MTSESIDQRDLTRTGDRLRLSRTVALSAGPAVSLGFGRFGYTLLLPSMRSQLHWSYTTAGVIGGANAVGYFIGSLLSAPAARRVGIRPLFLGSMVLTSIALLVTGFSTATPLIFALRSMAGLFGATGITCGTAILAQATGNQNRSASTRAIGVFFSGAGVAIVITGLLLPAFLFWAQPSIGWRLGWVLLFALSAIGAATVLRSSHLPRDPVIHPRATGTWHPSRFAPLMASYFLFGAGYIGYMTFIVAYLEDSHTSSLVVSSFWVVLGLAAIAGAFSWSPVIARLHSGRALSLILWIVGLGAVLPLVSTSPAVVIASAVLLGGTFLAVVAAVVAIAHRSLAEHHWPMAIATFTVAVAAGQCVGPVLSGVLSDGPGGLRAGLLISGGILALASLVALCQREVSTSADLVLAHVHRGL
jgi:predicted MFS family arabinose efflux permease